MLLPWKFVAKLYRQKYHGRLEKIECQREELRKLLKGKASRKAFIRKLFWDNELLVNLWIDIKDELPEEYTPCEVYCWGGAQFTAFHETDGNFLPYVIIERNTEKSGKIPFRVVNQKYFNKYGNYLSVTAWRPLSKPPNQDLKSVI